MKRRQIQKSDNTQKQDRNKCEKEKEQSMKKGKIKNEIKKN
jgi:hypothetical protein